MKRMLRKCWIWLVGLCIALAIGNSMTVMAASVDVSAVSFAMSDIRTSGSAEAFTGDNGKYAVIVFGGVGSCSLTNTTLEEMEISDELWVNSMSNVSGSNAMYYKAIEAAEITTSYAMPLVAYKNPQGELYEATTGSVSEKVIAEKLAEGGFEVQMPIVDYGMNEARRASANFDVRAYRANYADLEVAYGDEWAKYYRHYIEYGYGEGRRATY